MWEYDATYVTDFDLRRLIESTWERLPLDARRSLRGVKFVQCGPQTGPHASAGARDVEVYWPWTRFATEPAIVGVLAHELAHVAAAHYTKTASGAVSVAYAEAEADQLVRRWGFDQELAARRSWLGK